MSHKVISYELTAEGQIPSFVLDGGVKINGVLHGVSVDNPTGDFQEVTVFDNDVLTRLKAKVDFADANGSLDLSKDEPSQAEQDEFNLSKQAAENFATQKGISVQGYALTYYNLTTGSDIAHLFSCSGGYFIKAYNGEVSEWYQTNAEINGEKVFGISKDLETGETIDTYAKTDNGFQKTAQDQSTTDTVTTGFFGLPEDKRKVLADFKYQNGIQHYSDKSYGFIVEYRKF